MDLKQVDTELARLLEQRARLVTGRTDAPAKTRVFPETELKAFLRDAATVCEQLVRPKRVAFLGPLCTYTHEAAEAFFGVGIALAPVLSIPAVFDEVAQGQSDFGVVPIEYSTDGRVVDTLENFVNCRLEICGEVALPIRHALMAKCERSEIVEVHSKPQALSQCRHWLLKHLPDARLIAAESTAAAAKRAGTKSGIAAVASPLAAREYGLNILVPSIVSSAQNTTRFVVLRKTPEGKEPASTLAEKKASKTTLLFKLRHESGALADALMIFKRQHLNLTWIESFPLPDEPGRYLFFVDLEGHQTDLKVRRALAALEKKASRLDVLGSYRRADQCGIRAIEESR